MKFQQLGTSGIQISSIIFGCWQAAWPGVDERELVEAQIAAFEAGITTFDTAEAYGEGASERLLAKSLGNKRDGIVIATKVWAGNLTHDKIFEACERSLKNLGTDRIDLYQIHWPAGSWGSPVVPISETMSALTALKDQGKIRAIGVSNFSAEQIKEILAVDRVESNQPPYSLFWRQVESDVLPVCLQNDLSTLAYSPLAQGLLTGKFGSDHKFVEGDPRGGNKLFQPEHFARIQSALNELRPIAQAHNATLGNLALAWMLHQARVAPIVGARNADQARENARATEIQLTADEVSRIDAIGKSVTDHVGSSPLLWS